MSGSILINGLFIFMLAGFIGFEVIRRVSPLLHTPLMSLTNALDAIAVVGAIVLVGEHNSTLSAVLGTIAVVAASLKNTLWLGALARHFGCEPRHIDDGPLVRAFADDFVFSPRAHSGVL